MRIIRRIALAATLVLAGAGYAWTQLSPVPALPDAERRTEYNITSQTGPFNVGFALYGDGTDYQNWIGVYVNGVASTAYTLSSLSGPIGSIPLPITDARITFSSAQTGKVEIVGARRPRRTSQLSENRGVSAHDFNLIITDLTAQLRERWDAVTNRVLQVPPGETIPMLPPAAQRANTNLTFDNSGNPTASLPASGTYPISSAMAPVVAAASVSNAASQLGVTAVPVGSVMPFAGFTAPAKYDFAYGQAYSRANFPDLLAAVTSTQTGTCTNGSTSITGLSDTSQFGGGHAIESSRLPLANTIAVVTSSTSVTVAAAATSSGSCTVTVFPYGDGDGLTTFYLPDLRGNAVAGRDNMGNNAAGRLTSTWYGKAPALGAAGGNQTHTLTASEIPGITSTNSSQAISVALVGSVFPINTGIGNTTVAPGGATPVPSGAGTWSGTGTITGTANVSVTSSNTGGNAHVTVQPTVQLNYIIRVSP